MSTLYIAHLIFAHYLRIEPVRLHTLRNLAVDNLFYTVHKLLRTLCVQSLDSLAKNFGNNVDIMI